MKKRKKKDVEVTIYTQKQTSLSKTDVANFNKQYPKLTLLYTKVFHDRFLIVDNQHGYHIGASIKDAGKKCFAINLIKEMEEIFREIRIGAETTTNQAQTITISTQKQQKSIEQITIAISDISKGLASFIDSTGVATSSADALSQMVQELDELLAEKTGENK